MHVLGLTGGIVCARNRRVVPHIVREAGVENEAPRSNTNGERRGECVESRGKCVGLCEGARSVATNAWSSEPNAWSVAVDAWRSAVETRRSHERVGRVRAR